MWWSQLGNVGVNLFICCILVCSNAQNINYRLTDNVVPSLYTINIRVDLVKFQFDGIVTIELEAEKATSLIEVHQLDLNIDSDVSLYDEKLIRINVKALNYIEESQIFQIHLEKPLAVHQIYDLKIKFLGHITDDMKGLYRSPQYEDNVVNYIGTTFSAPAYARKIFPCFDEPRFKAKFHLTLTHKNSALSNMEVENNFSALLEDGDEWQITSFKETPRMSTYLLAFVISDFESNRNGNFSVYAPKKDIDDTKYALDVGQRSLEELKKYMNLPYQLQKMDFIAIDAFLMGAMENWGLITFKSSRILLPEGKRNCKRIQEITKIVTHELVHQFFGNEVTFEWWSWTWLNEGFATYLENVITDKLHPKWKVLNQFLVNEMQNVMIKDANPSVHAMSRDISTPKEISEIYDFVVYPKAASVIRMIEHIMTPEAFRLSLNEYITSKSLSTATDEDLFDMLDDGMNEFTTLTHPHIHDIFGSWSKNPGFPVLTVVIQKSDKNAILKQSRFVSKIGLMEESQFYIPTNYAFSSNPDFSNTTSSYYLNNVHETIRLPTMKADDKWVIFNLQQTGYYRVNYDQKNWDGIVGELIGSNYQIIHELNRAQLLDDVFNLARYNYTSFNTALNMIQYLKQEMDLSPLTAGFRMMEFLQQFLDDEIEFNKLNDILLEIADAIYRNINNLKMPQDPEEAHLIAVTKLTVNMFACKFGVNKCVQDASTELNKNLNFLVIEKRPYIYCGWSKTEFTTGLDLMYSHLMNISSTEELYRDNTEEIEEILNALSTCDSKKHSRANRMIEKLTTHDNGLGHLSNKHAITIIENLVKSGTKNRHNVLTFYVNNFDLLNRK
ncbi:unnamed protein product [Diamesa serratosioi]